MYRATTPLHTFTLPMNADECRQIQVIYRQGAVKLIKDYKDHSMPSGMSFDGKNVLIKLTQEESLMFKPDFVDVQVRVMTEAEDVYASQKFKLRVDSSLSEEVL